jgi:hypothetical protein
MSKIFDYIHEPQSAKMVKLATRRTGVETERSDCETEAFLYVCFADRQSSAHLYRIVGQVRGLQPVKMVRDD